MQASENRRGSRWGASPACRALVLPGRESGRGYLHSEEKCSTTEVMVPSGVIVMW